MSVKRSKMMRGSKTPLFMKASWLQNSSFESENKEGYIHGFNYVKVKPVELELVNTYMK
jgi:hypothetical protein